MKRPRKGFDDDLVSETTWSDAMKDQIPAALGKRFGLPDGSLVIAEEVSEGILLRPTVASALELYDDARAAGFLLSNASDADDYEGARAEVREMGIDPDAVPHRKPV